MNLSSGIHVSDMPVNYQRILSEESDMFEYEIIFKVQKQINELRLL